MKSPSKTLMIVPCMTALLSFALPASAQSLVNVDLRNANILSNIANHLSVNISNVPITVQAPISVAAVVCAVSVDVLSTTLRRGNTSCYAQSTSGALNKIVQKVINLQIQ